MALFVFFLFLGLFFLHRAVESTVGSLMVRCMVPLAMVSKSMVTMSVVLSERLVFGPPFFISEPGPALFLLDTACFLHLGLLSLELLLSESIFLLQSAFLLLLLLDNAVLLRHRPIARTRLLVLRLLLRLTEHGLVVRMPDQCSQSLEEVLLKELSQHGLHLARVFRVQHRLQLVHSQIEQDLSELKVDYLHASQVHEVLANHLLVPLFFGRLDLFVVLLGAYLYFLWALSSLSFLRRLSFAFCMLHNYYNRFIGSKCRVGIKVSLEYFL